MTENGVLQSINSYLSSFAGDILTSTHSSFLWGEVDVPECLREQVENDAE